MRGAYLGRTGIGPPGARERASFRQKQMRIEERPRCGEHRGRQPLLGGGLLPRGGLGSGEQTTIYVCRPRFPVPETLSRILKWPRPASQRRSHWSPQGHEINYVSERWSKPRNLVAIAAFAKSRARSLAGSKASGRVPTLIAHNIARPPTACGAFRKARFDQRGSVRGLFEPAWAKRSQSFPTARIRQWQFRRSAGEETRSRSLRRRFTFKLDIAFLDDGGLFDSDHLAFHLRKLSRGLLVATDKEGRGPENDNRGSRGPLIFGALAVLHT